MKKKSKLICRTYNIGSLNDNQIEQMYELFSIYYENSSFDQFKMDLGCKDIVFLLLDKKSRLIKGFSTLVSMEALHKGQMHRACFSGDTIIDRQYWGQGTLGVAFLRYLFLQKVRRPFQPLYWFLISKGYKTYLLMANNFKEHYPRFEKETPEKEKMLIELFSEKLYGEYYNKETGVIELSKTVSKDCLKSEVTPVTKELLLKNERVGYFVKKNPHWGKGNELACVAKMSLIMPLRYQLKVVKKKLKNKRLAPFVSNKERA